MAAKAFDVASAAFAEAYDPATRARLEGAYAARLVRSDLGPQVRGAVRRNDQQLPAMLDALAGFVDRLSPGAAASSNAASAELLEPDRPPLVGDLRRRPRRLLEPPRRRPPRGS